MKPVLAAFLIFVVPVFAADLPQTAKINVIVDTDAGTDDLMAIAFLLARDDVTIEAVVVSPGLAHAEAGAMNVLRILELAGRRDIPVYKGRETPLAGAAEFPAEWRKLTNDLPGITLPTAVRGPETRAAADYLAERLSRIERPVRILALGALTTLAEVLRRSPEASRSVVELVIMGGAVHVPGNLGDGGDFKTDNKTAEWNFFIDPMAADIVLCAGIKTRLVPLDATNRVPITRAFSREFRDQPLTPLGKLVAEILSSVSDYIDRNIYSAWDPLAAVALVDDRVIQTRPRFLVVRQNLPEAGRTVEVTQDGARMEVAFDADAAFFRRLFFDAFRTRERKPGAPATNRR